MKFYDCATAPSPRRVRIFLEEKGIVLPVVQVDLRAGEQFSDEFRAINPDCTVPVLELDDGTRITEVFAICQYLEALHPEPPLMGRNPTERALVTMWKRTHRAARSGGIRRNLPQLSQGIPWPLGSRCCRLRADSGAGRARPQAR